MPEVSGTGSSSREAYLCPSLSYDSWAPPAKENCLVVIFYLLRGELLEMVFFSFGLSVNSYVSIKACRFNLEVQTPQEIVKRKVIYLPGSHLHLLIQSSLGKGTHNHWLNLLSFRPSNQRLRGKYSEKQQESFVTEIYLVVDYISLVDHQTIGSFSSVHFSKWSDISPLFHR